MYYRLNEDLRLRGWKLLPTGIARKLSGKVEFLPPKVFRALQKALVPLPRDSPLFSPEECGALEQLLAEGILEESGHPAPLTEQQAYRTYPNRFLRSVHWAVTGKCNARCRHCCLSAPKRTDMQDEAGEFSHKECLETCDEEFRAYLDYIPRFFEDGAPINLLLAGFFSYRGGSCGIPFVKHEEGSDCGNLCLCGHARNRMYITPEGFMVPCISMGSTAGGRRRFPKIRETTLADALCGSFYMDFIDTRLAEYFAHNPGCAACEYRNRCAGGCRGNVDSDAQGRASVGAGTGCAALAPTGGDDLLARDEDTCRFFQGGWYDRLADLLKKIGARI